MIIKITFPNLLVISFFSLLIYEFEKVIWLITRAVYDDDDVKFYFVLQVLLISQGLLVVR